MFSETTDQEFFDLLVLVTRHDYCNTYKDEPNLPDLGEEPTTPEYQAVKFIRRFEDIIEHMYDLNHGYRRFDQFERGIESIAKDFMLEYKPPVSE
jgi:hypothetical protein